MDRTTAENRAKLTLKESIGNFTGIVCKVCPDGNRCDRETIITSGQIKFKHRSILPWEGVHDGGWEVTAVWMGKCKIKCKKC